MSALERRSDLTVKEELRGHLLAMSPATANRLLRPLSQADRPRGRGPSKAGGLLKSQIPIPNFAA